MKNNKSLIWGLVGLAIIILAGIYMYNREEARRIAEAETADRIAAAKQADEANKPAAEGAATADTQEQKPATAAETAPEKPETGTQDTAATTNQDSTTDTPSTAARTDTPPAAPETKSADGAQDTATEAVASAVTEDEATEKALPVVKPGENAEAANDGDATADTEEKSAESTLPVVKPVEPPASGGDATSAKEESTAETTRQAGNSSQETETAGTDDKPATAEEKPLETAALDTGVGTDRSNPIVQPNASDAKTADLQPPQFDLLRVEPDGSTVVAGRAKPGGKLEVVAGDTVVAETKVGSNGDFAAVLDEPLPPGDHEIVLRVVEDGEVVSSSEEVATVSVPTDDPESLLVMVTRPGEASRILTQPEASPERAQSDDMGTETKASDTASSETSDQPAVDEKIADGKESEEQKVEVATADTEEQRPAASAEASQTEENTQTAALTDKVDDKPASENPTQPAIPGARLRIDAVEIESGRVFVAGSAAPPGATVRVYADGEPIGDSRVSQSGRFLVEANRDISVGRHIFSADLMMPGSDASTMRVAVPFTRPRGNAVAGVAAPEKKPSGEDAAPQKDASAASTGAEEPVSQDQVSAAAKPDSEPSDAQVSSSSRVEPAKQTEAVAEGAKEDAVAERAEDSSAEQKETTSTADASSSSSKDLPVVRNAPATAAEASGAAKEEPTVSADSSTANSDGKATPQVAEKPATPEVADTSAPTEMAKKRDEAEIAVESATPVQQAEVTTTADTQSGTVKQSASVEVEEQGSRDDSAPVSVAAATDGTAEPPTVMQPALEPTDDSVIIRRGDTLWQISRRVYGRGVRYTTIYLANTDQISNPDFIEPGQIFMVPEEPLANAEELHRDRVRGR